LKDLGDGIFMIDTLMAGVPGFTAVYAVRGKKCTVLVDAGVSPSVDEVMSGLSEAGVEPGEVAWIVLTHVHLDHAGGAGYLLSRLPKARVVADDGAVAVLADPVRLVAGARRYLGSFAEMYGDMAPVPRERLVPASTMDELDLGDRTLKIVATPGHASSHQCVVDTGAGVLFSGDALGVYIAEEGVIAPVTPPPDFDLEKQRRTLETLSALGCNRTCFTHFGCAGPCSDLAARSRRALEMMVERVRRGMVRRENPAFLAEELVRIMEITSDYGRFMFGGMSLLNVNGIMRYLE
jgi:glyoxylase-like metal-dependent hydrolase (beta-lactamase superfamily II)